MEYRGYCIEEIVNNQLKRLSSFFEHLSSASSEEEARIIMNEASKEDFSFGFGSGLFDTPLIRCTSIDTDKEDIKSITDVKRFSYPPENRVIRPQRMNIINDPIFYSATDINTALLETGIKEGDEFYASIWTMADETKMRLFPSIRYDLICKLAETGNECFIRLKQLFGNDSIRFIFEKYAEIFSIPHDDCKDAKTLNKYIYFLSSALAYSLFRQQVPHNGFLQQIDAIMYPSVKNSEKSYNLAIRPEFVDKHMELQYVLKAVLTSGGAQFSFKYVGINEGEKLVWKQMHKIVKDVRIVHILDARGMHSPQAGECIYFHKRNYTIQEFEHFIKERFNSNDSPLKSTSFVKDQDIDIMDPTWIKAWEKDYNELFVLDTDDTTKVQVCVDIQSHLEANGVCVKDVFYNQNIHDRQITTIL